MLAGAKKKRVPLKVPKPGPAFAHCGGSSLGWGGSALDEAGLGTSPLTPDIESTPVFRVGPVPPFFGVENFLVSPPFSGVGFAPVFRVGILNVVLRARWPRAIAASAFLCAGYGRYCVCLLDGFDAPPFVGGRVLPTVARMRKGQPVQVGFAVFGVSTRPMLGDFDKAERFGFA